MKITSEYSATLEQLATRATGIEQSVKDLKTDLDRMRDSHRKQLLVKEEQKLKSSARIVILYLIVLTLLSSAAAIWLLIDNGAWSFTLTAALVCMVAGTFGSSVSAMLSALQRRAEGWEFSDGTPYPDDAVKQRFSERMFPFFLARPWLGAAVGFLVFVGGLSNYIGKFENPPELYKLTFLAIMGGLFAKTLIEKLKDVFDNLVGK
jgi:hypothetical protein